MFESVCALVCSCVRLRACVYASMRDSAIEWTELRTLITLTAAKFILTAHLPLTSHLTISHALVEFTELQSESGVAAHTP